MRKIFCLILIAATLSSPMQSFAQMRIDINIPTKTLSLYEDNTYIKTYPIAVGKPSTNSPIGKFNIVNKVVNPTWSPKGRRPVRPGPNNPLGTRWIGIYKSSYGIHGNNNPKSIGTYASHGCFRMNNYDVEELFDVVSKGEPVNIYYNTFITYNYNNPVLVVYPDSYYRKVNTSARIEEELAKVGLKGQIEQSKLDNLYKNINKKTVVFSKGWTLFINGELASSDTIIMNGKSELISVDRTGTDRQILSNDSQPISKSNVATQEKLLANVNDINAFLGTDIGIDSLGNMAYNGQQIYYETINGKTYASVMDCARSIGSGYTYDCEQEKLNLDITYGTLNERFFLTDIKKETYNVYIWVRDVVRILNYNAIWDEEKNALIVNGKEIKGKIIGERMYLTPKQVRDYFGIDCSYYSIQNKMKLTSK